MAEGQSTPIAQVEYREIPNHPGYRVGSDGSVWSCRVRVWESARRGCRTVLGDEWVRLNPTDHNGYPRVNFSGNHKIFVHRLVLEAFVGPCPEGMECCHSDGDPANNALSNLRWDTPSANMRDQIRHGTHFRAIGERNGDARLTEEKVRGIRADHAAGETTVSLAAKYGVGTTTIQRVVRRENWTHI